MKDFVDLISKAKNLKEEATHIIFQQGLNDILQSYGKVYYTGSYFLNLMIWPDIDIELSLKSDPFSLDKFFELGKSIANVFNVSSMTFHNRIIYKVFESSPDGLYWNIHIENDRDKQSWNIDLWSFTPITLEENWERMNQIADNLDGSKRKLIIKLKNSLLTEEGRTPMSSSYHIYQAILFENLRCEDEIINYLKTKGVDIK